MGHAVERGGGGTCLITCICAMSRRSRATHVCCLPGTWCSDPHNGHQAKGSTAQGTGCCCTCRPSTISPSCNAAITCDLTLHGPWPMARGQWPVARPMACDAFRLGPASWPTPTAKHANDAWRREKTAFALVGSRYDASLWSWV